MADRVDEKTIRRMIAAIDHVQSNGGVNKVIHVETAMKKNEVEVGGKLHYEHIGRLPNSNILATN